MTWITIDVEDERGRVREALVDGSQPPRIGEWFDDEGERVRRLPARVQARVKKSISAVTGYQLPRLKDVERHGFARAPRYNDRGYAVFDSRKEVDDYVARYNDNPVNGGSIAWDPDGNE